MTGFVDWLGRKPPSDDAFEILQQAVIAAARNMASRGDHRIISPSDGARTGPTPGTMLRIGLFGNLANQSYIMARALRRLGHNVDLVVQQNNIDAHALSRPFWEECDFEGTESSEALRLADAWEPPAFVRRIAYDLGMQQRYRNRFSAVEEVIQLYREAIGHQIPRDLALVLAQWMGHWPYICAMNDYDVVHLSMWPICLGIFSPKPYVACPLGGDLFITAFEEDLQGLMFRASFRGASHIAVAETNYSEYLDRLETQAPRTFLPLIVDTDVYKCDEEPELRKAWHELIGGERFLLSVCRQSWAWKGNDRLVRAFAQFIRSSGASWRLILQEWGDDIDKTKELVDQLGLKSHVLWQGLCSKPVLRRRERAADVICDQCVMEGYGASVLEALAAGKPVVMAPAPEHAASVFSSPPPFVGGRTEDMILAGMERLSDDAFRAETGRASRAWLEREHGYRVLADRYLAMFHAAARSPFEIQGPSGSATGAPDHATFLGQLQRLHADLRFRLKQDWNRSLPIGDLIGDRWERARFLGLGEGSSIYDSAVVIGNVSVGAQTWIGPDCIIDGSGGLCIGSTCSISAGCQIYSHDSVGWAVTGGAAPYHRKSTKIGNCVYFGPSTIVAAGVSIGDHSIVGALSFVKDDLPPYSFAVGVPARVIGRVRIRDDNTYEIVSSGSDSKIGAT
jgi:acetyltransferase-like isoleucine patch superfamily enzyme/glycosyltransferase involved in cell wall biosynthesis